MQIMANTQYDDIAEEYKEAVEVATQKYIASPALFDLLGDLVGKRVLDLACGSGYFTRLIKEHGAEEVVGIDISAKEIELARKDEEENPLGVEYVIGDIGAYDFSKLEPFDIVGGAHVLQYAASKEELGNMCKGAYSALKPGAKLVVINSNPNNPTLENPKYGVTCGELGGDTGEGSVRRIFFYKNEVPMFHFDIYFWKQETYERSLSEAGFVNIKWHDLEVSKEGVERFGNEFWNEWRKSPHLIGITCEKP